jgi:P pilus assembly chaperone PapD
MRHSSFFRLSVVAVIAAAALAVAPRADAADEFDLSVNSGQVVVTAKGNWHINVSYPWKLTVGDKNLDASKFALSEKSAKVTAPKGTGKLRGGVCNGDQCRMFQESVTIP